MKVWIVRGPKGETEIAHSAKSAVDIGCSFVYSSISREELVKKLLEENPAQWVYGFASVEIECI